MCRGVTGGQDGRVVLAGFTNGNFFARLHGERRDIHLLAVHLNVTMAHNLPGLCTTGGQTHPVKHTVQAAFEAAQQVLTGDALHPCGFFKGVAELTFQNAVNPADLLLFAELQAVAYQLSLAVFPVLSGDKIATFDGALLRVATFAFQKQFHAFAPAESADRASITCQVLILLA